MTKQVTAALAIPAKTEYTLLALIELASLPDSTTPLTASEIALRHSIPERYLEQVLGLLRHGGLIQSQRGHKGGYLLTRQPWQITVLEVVELLKGNGGKSSETNSAANLERELISEVWKQARSAADESLRNCTLQDLVQRCLNRKQQNPMFHI